MNRYLVISALVFLTFLSCGKTVYETESGMSYEIISFGNGPIPQKGQVVSFQYTKMLLDGTKVDSSYDLGVPMNTIVGVHNMIKGLDEIIMMMPVGSHWLVTVPPELAYRDREMENIPPNSTLKFDIQLNELIDSEQVTESGIRYTIVRQGTGPAAQLGETCNMHYNVWLPGWEKLDSSLYSGKPFRVTVGETRVIDGWMEVLAIMPEGSHWKVTIPWQLAYGESGRDPIPPKTDLVFEMMLSSIER